MDLLKTLLLYLTMVFVSSVQTAPDPSQFSTPTPAPASTVSVSATAAATAAALVTPSPTPVPTPDITPNDTYKTLKVGDRGDRVKEMQQRLAELGYFSGEIDGAFGNQTRRAVESFQYYQGLSVDGIAGKRTLTVLYESDEVVPAPTETGVTPSPSATVGPTSAITSALEQTPLPTFVPLPSNTAANTDAAKALATDTPVPSLTPAPDSGTPSVTETAAQTATLPTEAPSEEPTVSANAETTAAPSPVLLSEQTFQLSGSTDALTLSGAQTAEDTAVTLHPLAIGDLAYAPLLEILRDANVVVLPGNNPDQTEIAFALGNAVYQITYTLDPSGTVTNLKLLQNQQPLILTPRNAVMIDSILYLPMAVITEATKIEFSWEESIARYTVTLPAQ